MRNHLLYFLLVTFFCPNLFGQSITGTVLSAHDSLPISGEM